MKIGVVGTFNRDRIFPWKGGETKSVGGLFYTVSYMASLALPHTEIIPVCFIGADFFDEVRQRLQLYPNVVLDGMTRLHCKNTAVTLRYIKPQEREETISELMPPLAIEQLAILKEVDVVVVNLITGFDLSLTALQDFRKISDAKIYLDFHSHALGIDDSGKRFYARPADWASWVASSDILQLNALEAKVLAGLPEEAPSGQLFEFGKTLIAKGLDICHITLGARGSLLCYRSGGRIQSEMVRAPAVHKVVDVIGCGDAFAAAFVTEYFDGAGPRAATVFAHKIASANSTFVGSDAIVADIKKRLSKKV